MRADQSLQERSCALESLGAIGAEIDELLAYNENVFAIPQPVPDFPLPDEPFVEAWRDYSERVTEASSIAPLSEPLLQLRFPIRAGVSEDAAYRDATQRGVCEVEPGGTGCGLLSPESCSVTLYDTPAGRIPVLLAGLREDFVTLVRAFTKRNEPAPVPAAMGAVMVAGYNNWDRIAKLRAVFESRRQTWSWAEEFRRVRESPAQYQDRFIILSSGPYSGRPAAEFGFPEADWSNSSLIIRREHEAAHYFTKRVFQSMRNNLIDEIIADYFGIAAAAGRFRADWMLRFFGLEDYPRYRAGGRLENYRGNPPLNDGAFMVVLRLVKRAAENLEDFDDMIRTQARAETKPALFFCLARLTLDQLASTDAPEKLAAALTRIMGSAACGEPAFNISGI